MPRPPDNPTKAQVRTRRWRVDRNRSEERREAMNRAEWLKQMSAATEGTGEHQTLGEVLVEPTKAPKPPPRPRQPVSQPDEPVMRPPDGLTIVLGPLPRHDLEDMLRQRGFLAVKGTAGPSSLHDGIVALLQAASRVGVAAEHLTGDWKIVADKGPKTGKQP